MCRRLCVRFLRILSLQNLSIEENDTNDTISEVMSYSEGEASSSAADSPLNVMSASGVAYRHKRKSPATNDPEKKEKRDETIQAINNVLRELQTEAASIVDDEFEIFGRFKASELRSWPNVYEARRMKIKLQAFFSNMLLETVSECGAEVLAVQTMASVEPHKQLSFDVIGEDGAPFDKNKHKSCILVDSDGAIASDPSHYKQNTSQLGDQLKNNAGSGNNGEGTVQVSMEIDTEVNVTLPINESRRNRKQLQKTSSYS